MSLPSRASLPAPPARAQGLLEPAPPSEAPQVVCTHPSAYKVDVNVAWDLRESLHLQCHPKVEHGKDLWSE